MGKTEGELTKKPRNSSRILLSLLCTQRRYIYISIALIMQIAHWFVRQDTRILFALLPAPSPRTSILLLCSGHAVSGGGTVGRSAATGLQLQSSPPTAGTPALIAGLVSKANGMEDLRKVVMGNNACYNHSSCLLCAGYQCERPPAQPSS